MNIKPIIYDSLTPQQRVVAAVEALARDDDAEHKKLTETCPKKNYIQPDYQYSGMLHGLIGMAIANEHELTSNALSLFLCISPKSNRGDLAETFLQRLIDCNAAWNETLESMGIDPETMSKLCHAMRHPIVNCFLNIAVDSDIALSPDEEAVKAQRQKMEYFFGKIRNV